MNRQERLDFVHQFARKECVKFFEVHPEHDGEHADIADAAAAHGLELRRIDGSSVLKLVRPREKAEIMGGGADSSFKLM